MLRYFFYLLISYLAMIIISPKYKKANSVKSKKYKSMSFEHFNTINYKNNFIEELEISIIFRSGIRDIIPKINIENFLYFILALFLVCLFIFIHLIKLLLPSIILSIIISLFPFAVISMMEQRRNDLVSKELTRFISVISKWAVVKDDIFYCFEKSLDQIDDPIKSYINEFLMNVKYTGNVSYAFDILILQSRNEMYRNFIINIRQAEKSKGNLPLLLDYIEEETYKIESENSRRKSATLRDRTIIYFTMIAVLIIGGTVLKFNDGISMFYLNTVVGKYLLTFYLILFSFGILVASKITAFDY